MKTRYGIARGYARDENRFEYPYYFVAECYMDYDDIVSVAPAKLQGFESEQEAIRTLATVVMDIMANNEVVDTKQFSHRERSVQT